MVMMHQDFIQDILLHLPVKSLARCTCLSQDLHAFISYNKSFHSSYISRNTGCDQVLKGFFLSKEVSYGGEEPVRFLPTSSEGKSISVLKKRKRKYDEDTSLADYYDDFAFPVDASLSFLGHDVVHVWGSSNGCLLTTLERESPMTYMICNPLNKQHIVLPKPISTTRLVVHGFSCDAALTHYKIVRGICLDALEYTTRLTLEIFSSDLPQWRPYEGTCSIPFFLDMPLRCSAMINEGMTFVPAYMEKQHTSRSRPQQCVIISNQFKETVQVKEMPPNEDHYKQRDIFGMSNGLIAYGRYEFDQLKVWLLDDKGGDRWEWSPKHMKAKETETKMKKSEDEVPEEQNERSIYSTEEVISPLSDSEKNSSLITNEAADSSNKAVFTSPAILTSSVQLTDSSTVKSVLDANVGELISNNDVQTCSETFEVAKAYPVKMNTLKATLVPCSVVLNNLKKEKGSSFHKSPDGFDQTLGRSSILKNKALHGVGAAKLVHDASVKEFDKKNKGSSSHANDIICFGQILGRSRMWKNKALLGCGASKLVHNADVEEFNKKNEALLACDAGDLVHKADLEDFAKRNQKVDESFNQKPAKDIKAQASLSDTYVDPYPMLCYCNSEAVNCERCCASIDYLLGKYPQSARICSIVTGLSEFCTEFETLGIVTVGDMKRKWSKLNDGIIQKMKDMLYEVQKTFLRDPILKNKGCSFTL